MRPKQKMFKTLPLKFYGFSPVSRSVSKKSKDDSTSDPDKSAVDDEGNGDESSQDSGIGLETSTGRGKPIILSDETNLCGRWAHAGEKSVESRGHIHSLYRSLSVPVAVKSPGFRPLLQTRLTTTCRLLTGQPLLSPVRDIDDGFAEPNECDGEVFGSQTNVMQQSRKRRRVVDNIENETPAASSKLPRNVLHSCSSSNTLLTNSLGENESVTPKAITKQRQSTDEPTNLTSSSGKASRRLMRCHSEAVIRSALSSSEECHDLIGDFSRPYSLPVITGGKHQDLKSISPETMARLLSNEFTAVSAFVIIDCRYPYEFDGGHLSGAKNIYTKEGIINEFLMKDCMMKNGSAAEQKIIIFHCEFSSERGPKLMRFLRNKDRDNHQDCYPTLKYPECYLLEGGYKAFFEVHPGLCEPRGYRQMIDPQHAADLKHFRLKSRSWPAVGVDDASRQRRARSCLKL